MSRDAYRRCLPQHYVTKIYSDPKRPEGLTEYDLRRKAIVRSSNDLARAIVQLHVKQGRLHWLPVLVEMDAAIIVGSG